MMTQDQLLERLRLIEALHAGAGTEGERVAAAHARQRILERLSQMQEADPPIEYRFGLQNAHSTRLMIALLRRYQIRPYRYPRQRYTTVMARVSRRFVNETLWPEYCDLNRTLRQYMDEVTAKVISAAIDGDSSDAEVRPEPAGLTSRWSEQADGSSGDE